jgi:crotonobetainyl-CoA:carnitine CoA-transferase CaiB-like acyl-CoA transferase
VKPLGDIRILDFTMHAAGPFCTHLLAQLGAECIKVESASRADIFRRPHPVYGRMTAASFDQVASAKRSIRLNLKHPQAAEMAARLAGICDVVAESFRPGVVDRLGIGYDALRAVRADIVMISVSASGQYGPDANFSGYAPMFGAWGGLGYLTGYRDGPPVEMRHVMDHTVGLHAALATVAALQHRRVSGLGCHVDVSARDVASALAGDALLQASAGERPTRIGNEQAGAAPHGVYPTRVADRWISISVQRETAWLGLLTVMGSADLARDPRFVDPHSRYVHRRELDVLVTAWTSAEDGDQLVNLLQEHGVPAHMSWTQADIVTDPHLRERGVIVDVTERDGATRAAIGVPILFADSNDVGIRSGTPELGEAEDYVYGELLGISRHGRMRLVDERVIY